ncbi:cobalt ABC transporter ATP-binding protein [Aquitalea sp. FJL05]|uniref:energy-coupling factor ABC transporter ATP-binding protein n=1 Tax=Aquitalea TaxID=407217 RepID=UPI000F5A6811|nr:MULTISPECIES: ATP-binding cassette domain-containing protein [Aquitalea]RQO73225.1 cobalt ABC transporter ATP-binding protein [Aquitalea sp. FJL05]
MNTILSVQQLGYTFPGNVIALSGINLSIQRGRCLALLGPNGSGKSTFLQHLNGTLRPDHGSVLLEQEAVTYSRQGLNRLRSKVGLVLQDADDQLFAASVFEDISFGPLNQGLEAAAAQQRVEEAIRAMGLAGLENRPPHMLSGGQKKRVAIAGALAMAPEVLLLDEPTAGLDHEGIAQLIEILQTLMQQGITIVFSTHDVDLACGLADDIALFAAGRVIGFGERRQILLDKDMLLAAKLSPSLLLQMVVFAQDKGLLAADAVMPRTAGDIMALVGQWQHESHQTNLAD